MTDALGTSDTAEWFALAQEQIEAQTAIRERFSASLDGGSYGAQLSAANALVAGSRNVRQWAADHPAPTGEVQGHLLGHIDAVFDAGKIVQKGLRDAQAAESEIKRQLQVRAKAATAHLRFLEILAGPASMFRD